MMEFFTKHLMRFVPKAVLVAFGFLMLPATAMGDETTTAERWKGSDVASLTRATNTATGTMFYLYNVGTGKFLIAGGAWGATSMLLYQDYGAPLSLYETTVSGTTYTTIQSGNQNHASNRGKYVGVNYPGLTSSRSWNATGTTRENFDVVMEAKQGGTKGGTYYRNMTFTRVENSGDVYTYYITEDVTNSSSSITDRTFYIGAGKGVDTSTGTDDETVSTDKVAYTQTQATQTGNKNYQWRVVTQEQLEDVLKTENASDYEGLNAKATYLISDPNFDRNCDDEWSVWTATNGTTQGNSRYYRYAWYTTALDATTTQSSYWGSTTTETPWDKAVGTKVEFKLTDYGQYGFAMLDGIGTLSQTITVPVEGWYKVECRGLWQGNEASLYASDGTTTKTQPLTAATGLTKTKYDSNSGTSYTNYDPLAVLHSSGLTYGYAKPNNAGLLSIGQLLYNNEGGNYTKSVLIYVAEGGKLTFGIQKTAATRSDDIRYYNTWYYYDKDIAAFDNFNLYYLGKEKPFLLDEDKDDDAYITAQTAKNLTTYLHSTFTVNEWNTLVLPVSMTNAQVTYYFGAGVQVAKLDGVSTHQNVDGSQTSTKPLCLDFKTLDLSGETFCAIEAGKPYLVKPTAAGSETYSVTEGDETTTVSGCYLIGRHDYSGEKPDPTAIYSTTGGDEAGKVKFQGTYKAIAADSDAAPQAGAYMLSKSEMSHLISAMQVKGFRGWFTEIAGTDTGTRGITFCIDGVGGDTTGIDTITTDKLAPMGGNVYSISGQLVRSNATTLEGLSRGVYIVNGKKYIVK